MSLKTLPLAIFAAMNAHQVRQEGQRPVHQPTIVLTPEEIDWSEAGKIQAAEAKRVRKAAKLK